MSTWSCCKLNSTRSRTHWQQMDKQISNSNKTMLVHTPLNEPLNSSKHSQENMDLQSWTGRRISPDLSLIENLWAHLKDELRKQYPDTATLKGSARTIKATLQQRLHKIWWDIGEEVLNRLVEDMPKRCKEVIAVRGWYTGH